MGTGLERMMFSRISEICSPTDKSITVSAPLLMASVNFTISSFFASALTASEVPILALIFVLNCLPMTIGRASGCKKFNGKTARREAISFFTVSPLI